MATTYSLKTSITELDQSLALKLILSTRESRKHRKRTPSQKTKARKILQTIMQTLTQETARQFLELLERKEDPKGP